MADPLSVAASIAGLLTAAQLVSAGIGRVVSSKKSGLREIRDIKTTVDTLRSVLSQLQLLLLSRASIDPRRASLIMVDEVVATLTACVMTFSDLDGCVKGLGSGEELNNLNWVGGVKWLSKSTELKGYLQNLEAHKTSLILMTNILTCQTAQNAETAAGELRMMMVSMMQSNLEVAERMAAMERSMAPSTIAGEEYERLSTLSQHTIGNDTISPTTITSQAKSIPHPAFGFTFDEDLRTSWVYQRSRARSARSFSIASSSQVTQSWSFLSGLSLSNISNIAVQALPIFEEDLQNSKLYSFGNIGHLESSGEEASVATQNHGRNLPDSARLWGTSTTISAGSAAASASGFGRSEYLKRRLSGQISLPQDMSQANRRLDDLADDLSAGELRELMERDQKRKDRLRERERVRDRERMKRDFERRDNEKIAEAVVIQSVSKMTVAKPTVEGTKIPKELKIKPHSPNTRKSFHTADISIADFLSSTVDEGVLGPQKTKLPPNFSTSMHPPSVARASKSQYLIDDAMSSCELEPAEPQPEFLLSDQLRGDVPDDTFTQELKSARKRGKVSHVLWLAVSLCELDGTAEPEEEGFPYIPYTTGEIFDVIAESGELWLAWKHGDQYSKAGWLRSANFARVAEEAGEIMEGSDSE